MNYSKIKRKYENFRIVACENQHKTYQNYVRLYGDSKETGIPTLIAQGVNQPDEWETVLDADISFDNPYPDLN